MSDRPILKIAVNVPLSREFDYLPPQKGSEPFAGCRVRVPFGRREQVGVVLGSARTSDVPAAKMKRCTEVLDETAVLSAADLWLIRFTSNYYHHPIGEVVAAALPSLLRQGKPLHPTIERVVVTEPAKQVDLDAVRRLILVDVAQGETCDEGAALPTATCGTACLVIFCGNGLVDDGEVCDDGNVAPGDGCSPDCQSDETCGNGIIDAARGEGCDEGSGNSDTAPDACRATCVRSWCGDGTVDSDESCDDATANSDTQPDACRASSCRPRSAQCSICSGTLHERSAAAALAASTSSSEISMGTPTVRI